MTESSVEVPKSYLVEVKADSSGTWSHNSLRFTTHREACQYGWDLTSRWTAVREWRASESSDPPTHRFVNNHAEALETQDHAEKEANDDARH